MYNAYIYNVRYICILYTEYLQQARSRFVYIRVARAGSSAHGLASATNVSPAAEVTGPTLSGPEVFSNTSHALNTHARSRHVNTIHAHHAYNILCIFVSGIIAYTPRKFVLGIRKSHEVYSSRVRKKN